MAASKQFLKGLMDNPNFQKWFGESVVRDAEGLPLEVYHGTVNDFTSFNPSFKAETHPKFNDSKQSIFLTSNPRLAQDYTGMVESDLSDEALKRFGLNRIDAPDGANIKSGYLSLINPYQVDAAGAEYNRRKMIDWIESARGNGNDGLIVKNLDDSMYKGSPDRADVYAIFDPTQFKSRFNAGTFDPTDPNFLKSIGLMTAGAGAAAYAMSPDDAEAAKLDAKKIIMNIMRKHDPYESKFYELGIRRNTNVPGEVPTSLRVGDELSPSRRWYDGDPTDEVLSGTSTVGLSDKNVDEAMRRIKGYSSDDPNLYIVGGDSAMGGEDVGEKVLTNAKVAGVFSPDKYNFALPLGLVGAAAYGLMGSDNDAEAMYIGPKGLANLLGPDTAKKLLTDAEQMAAKGVDNEAVRQATGLFQGMDGKWRYEIPDNSLRIDYNALKPDPDLFNTSGALVNSVSHDSLFSAYPDIGSEKFSVSMGNWPRPSGSFSQDGIAVRGDSGRPPATLIHELQHAIQQREGFARGGSPVNSYVTRNLGDITPLVPKERATGGSKTTGPILIADDDGKLIITDGNHRYWDAMNRGDKTIDTLFDPSFFDGNSWSLSKAIENAPVENYKNLAGEIEARDVANRMNLTPEQRLATPPDLRDNAIVRFEDGTAASVPQRREWARDAGNNTPNVAQAVTPPNPFTPSPSQLASTAALVAALKSKDAPLEDTYQPADLLTAFLTGGGGLAGRSIQAALDPVFSAAMDYAPRVADAINPRNIIMGLMR